MSRPLTLSLTLTLTLKLHLGRSGCVCTAVGDVPICSSGPLAPNGFEAP